MGQRPTDQRIAGGGAREGPVEAERPNLNNWIVFGRLKIFNFAELCARYIPDPERMLRIRFGREPFGFLPSRRGSDSGGPISWSAQTAADRLVSCCGGQATKGTRWMPWRQEPMKDVAGCVKPRGVASRR